MSDCIVFLPFPLVLLNKYYRRSNRLPKLQTQRTYVLTKSTLDIYHNSKSSHPCIFHNSHRLSSSNDGTQLRYFNTGKIIWQNIVIQNSRATRKQYQIYRTQIPIEKEQKIRKGHKYTVIHIFSCCRCRQYRGTKFQRLHVIHDIRQYDIFHGYTWRVQADLNVYVVDNSFCVYVLVVRDPTK